MSLPLKGTLCHLVYGQPLEQVHSYSYLGVSIDGNLNFGKFLREKYGLVQSRIYQLSRMWKYINSSTASLIYKQMILSISNYADIMVKRGPQNEVTRQTKLQERAVKIIDNNSHSGATLPYLINHYRIIPVEKQQDEHLCSFMYRMSKNPTLLCHDRPEIHLRGHNKIKFMPYNRTYERYLKSPLSRGTSLWDRLPEEIQRSTTKFKFKKQTQDLLR